jgi:uncharacterized repeat protein (TIGR03843 family)
METPRPALADEVELLSSGEVEVLGHIPYSSNYVFLARVTGAGTDTLAIYKPTKGERPLWDFPQGTLAARETAAFEVSESSGWRFVPPTVLRGDAPLGRGSLQLFVEHDPERHYFTLAETRLEDFVSMAAFDVVVNNADRKAGHVLEDPHGKLWAVDHGVTFHVQPKLRTVIWHLAGCPLDQDTVAGLRRLCAALRDDAGLKATLARLLSAREIAATLRRAERLLAAGRLPHPTSDHHVPWPLI